MSTGIEALAGLCAEYTHDPLGWAEVAYEWGEGELSRHSGPRRWQAESLETIGTHLQNPATRFTPLLIAVASGHGIGKSALIGMIVNWGLSTCTDTKVLITANTDTQLRTKTSPEVGKWQRMSVTSEFFECNSASIASRDKAHAKEWRADFVPWSEHNTEAFAGLHNEGKRIIVIYDEASKIHDKVWEVTEGALTDENTEIIWIAFGNPTQSKGRFRECFRKFKHRWITKQIDSRTVEGTNKDQLAKWIADYGEDSDFCKVRIRGMFPAMSAKQYISEARIDAAFGKHLKREQFSFAPKIISCDPAWDGGDEIVIAMRQGLHYQVLKTLAKNDNDIYVATLIAQFEDEHEADAVFIDGGFGTGIVSAGRTWGRDWQLVWFAGESADIGCLNKRAEIYKLVNEWLKEGGAIPEDNQLRDELLAIETVERMDGKIQIKSKEQIRDEIGCSPNRADALAITFAFPVVKKDPHRRQRNETQRKQEMDYDPLSRAH